MNEEKNKDEFIYDGMDFDKFAYFSSKGKNYAIIFKPRVEEVLASGERRVAKDDDGNLMNGVRIEFHNGMKRIEKTKENMPMIEFLREKCEKEKSVPLNRQQLKEIVKPVKKISEDKVKAMLAEKDAEIAKLKGEKKEEIKKEETQKEETKVTIDNGTGETEKKEEKTLADVI